MRRLKQGYGPKAIKIHRMDRKDTKGGDTIRNLGTQVIVFWIRL